MTSHTGSGDPHSRLNELRTAVIQRAASLASSFDGILEATRDVATDDEHDPEGRTIAWERQQIAALIDEARVTLADIEAAQQRLANGLYGTWRSPVFWSWFVCYAACLRVVCCW